MRTTTLKAKRADRTWPAENAGPDARLRESSEAQHVKTADAGKEDKKAWFGVKRLFPGHSLAALQATFNCRCWCEGFPVVSPLIETGIGTPPAQKR
jgi:hypothetical protein